MKRCESERWDVRTATRGGHSRVLTYANLSDELRAARVIYIIEPQIVSFQELFQRLPKDQNVQGP